jgi:hypothetical protein
VTGSGRSGTGNAAYRRNRLLVLANSDVCGICGHRGSMTADHIIPPARWPRDLTGRLLPGLDDVTNLRPAHGTLGAGRGRTNPCPTCGRLCNQSRGNRAARRPQSQDWFPRGIPRG